MAQLEEPEPPPSSRTEYLELAITCRNLASAAHDPDVRQQLMRLTVMYEELAEFSARTSAVKPCADPASHAGRAG